MANSIADTFPMHITHLHIPTLDDATDSGHLEKALEAVPGVTSVAIEPEAKQARVEHDGADTHQMTWALLQLGYYSQVH